MTADTLAASPELSIVMPCLNEARTLGRCIAKAQAFVASHGVQAEIIVADNGSTDGSQDIARALGVRVIAVTEAGYGAALRGGIEASHGRYIIMGDADDSYDFGALGGLLAALRAGADLVMGNRFAGGIHPGAMPFLHRYLGNPVLSALGRWFFKSPCRDFHCGLRGFTRRAYEAMDLRTTGMEFASEMVVKASLMAMQIAEVPVELHPDGRGRPPHLRTWRDGWRHLRFLLLYSPRWLFVYPGALLMLLGLVSGLLLIAGPRQWFGLTFDVHTLVYSTVAIIIGLQILLFGTFARVFAASEGLLPPSARLNAGLQKFPLEAALVLGLLLLLAGVGGAVYAVALWGDHAFGDLEPRQLLRVVIPSALAMGTGVEIIFSAFLLSILRLGRR